MLIDHTPQGSPCRKCNQPVSRHRVKHIPNGDPCSCGVPNANHRLRIRTSNEMIRRRDYERIREKFRDRGETYIGIDGEGQGRIDHKYVFLAASDETGKRQWSVENKEGLTTIECLEFLLRLPHKRSRFFAYAFNYDITKILRNVDDKRLYALTRPELRQRQGKEAMKGPKPVRWNGYDLNLQGTKFTIDHKSTKRRIVIWDIFRFYGSKFVNALKDWKTGTDDVIRFDDIDPRIVAQIKQWENKSDITSIPSLDFMQYMKDKRAEFDKLSATAIRKYCFDECSYIAQQARKLTDAHTKIGLRLTGYYGAGSSASAMLKVMGIREKIRPPPKEMLIAVAMGFFGGRFENSVIGAIEEKVWNYDISSAYPYQLCFLPCLLHGTWELSRRRSDLEKSRSALVEYRLPDISSRTKETKFDAWGPFPFRTEDGTIAFPKNSGGGFVWKDEYLQGERLFPNVQFKQAWIYHCDCDCKPFGNIPGYYLERIRIGKEGPGIVLKLGCNSCYGKLAQSIGLAPFNSWIWAGLITSGTRAQMLEMLGLHHDWSNLLMVATDGLYTRERIPNPRPRDTGTFSVSKPLGGWEEKLVSKGVFVSRPGIYFPLNPTKEEIKDVRGRGVGKGVILENHRKIVEAWRAEPSENTVVRVDEVTRFCGAKSSISFSEKHGFRRSHNYGQWVTRPVDMSFHPRPKRECVNPDGLTLKLRSFPGSQVSKPYSRAMVNAEITMLRAAMLEASEQPDGGDLSDYEPEMML